MNDDTETIEYKAFSDALNIAPEEVQNFVTSDTFNVIIDSIQQVLELTDEQKEQVRTIAYEVVLRVVSNEEAARSLTHDGMSPELAIKVLYAIDTSMVNPLLYMNEFFTEEPSEENTTTETKETPSRNDILATIGDRLSSSSTITPTKRDYSMTTPSTPVERTPNSLDPYRELPEK